MDVKNLKRFSNRRRLKIIPRNSNPYGTTAPPVEVKPWSRHSEWSERSSYRKPMESGSYFDMPSYPGDPESHLLVIKKEYSCEWFLKAETFFYCDGKLLADYWGYTLDRVGGGRKLVSGLRPAFPPCRPGILFLRFQKSGGY